MGRKLRKRSLYHGDIDPVNPPQELDEQFSRSVHVLAAVGPLDRDQERPDHMDSASSSHDLVRSRNRCRSMPVCDDWIQPSLSRPQDHSPMPMLRRKNTIKHEKQPAYLVQQDDVLADRNRWWRVLSRKRSRINPCSAPPDVPPKCEERPSQREFPYLTSEQSLHLMTACARVRTESAVRQYLHERMPEIGESGPSNWHDPNIPRLVRVSPGLRPVIPEKSPEQSDRLSDDAGHGEVLEVSPLSYRWNACRKLSLTSTTDHLTSLSGSILTGPVTSPGLPGPWSAAQIHKLLASTSSKAVGVLLLFQIFIIKIFYERSSSQPFQNSSYSSPLAA